MTWLKLVHLLCYEFECKHHSLTLRALLSGLFGVYWGMSICSNPHWMPLNIIKPSLLIVDCGLRLQWHRRNQSKFWINCKINTRWAGRKSKIKPFFQHNSRSGPEQSEAFIDQSHGWPMGLVRGAMIIPNTQLHILALDCEVLWCMELSFRVLYSSRQHRLDLMNTFVWCHIAQSAFQQVMQSFSSCCTTWFLDLHLLCLWCSQQYLITQMTEFDWVPFSRLQEWTLWYIK